MSAFVNWFTRGTGAVGRLLIGGKTPISFRVGAVAPTDGTTGTGAGQDNPGSKYYNSVTGLEYVNQGTKASPQWRPASTGSAVDREVYNATGSTITKGALVALSGWDETTKLPKVVLADNDAASGRRADYVAVADILTSTAGIVATTYRFTAQVTTGFTVGDAVYLDSTAGGWTHTEPSGADAFDQVVGRVAVVHASAGVVEFDVRPFKKIGTSEIENGAVTAAKLDGGVVAATIDAVTITATGAGSTAEVPLLHSVVAGTAPASKVPVLDAQKALDTVRATTDLNVGGTGVPGAAKVQTSITKEVTGLADTVATDVLTVTVPNAQHAARIEVDVLGILGAGGAIGLGEATMAVKYVVSLARTAGVAVVAGISSVIGSAESHVAGGDAITSVVATLSSITGGVTVSETFTIKIAITRSGAGATNHKALIAARIVNENATGVTIA